MVTLALNIAEPLIARDYGKAAFDAVGPLLLIGWSEVGPGLLQAMQLAGDSRKSADDGAVLQCGPDGAKTTESSALSGKGWSGRRNQEDSGSGGHKQRSAKQDLLHRARAEDSLHWSTHHRPISADTLRKRLRIGAPAARGLVTQLRTDTGAKLHPVPAADSAPSPDEPAAPS
ncbi:hypothetical protein FRAHR75_1160017 [Frankia sp. Hr75.2]|nr:hypothetical protein FRAHR75_1160017 [Frankia sp. Hr75.2]